MDSRTEYWDIDKLAKALALSNKRLQPTLYLLREENIHENITAEGHLWELRASMAGQGDLEILSQFETAFDTTGEIDHLDNAILQAKGLVASSSPSTIQSRLCTLVRLLKIKSDKSGDREDLGKTILWMEVEVAIMPKRGPSLARKLNGLALIFEVRYKKYGNLKDIDKAIKRATEAIKALPPTPLYRPAWLRELDRILPEVNRRLEKKSPQFAMKRGVDGVKNSFPELDKPGVLPLNKDQGDGTPEKPTKRQTLLVDIAPAMLPYTFPRPRALANLENPYSNKYNRPGALDNIELAIQRCEDTADTVPPDNSNRTVLSGTMCSLYAARYEWVGEVRDLEQSIKLGRETWAAAEPLDAAYRATALLSLANSLHLRYRRTESTQDFFLALGICHECWLSRLVPPRLRIDAACIAGLLFSSRNMWQESSSILRDAGRMFAELTSGSFEGGYQLTSFTLSVSLQASEEVAHSLTLLELNRGIMMGIDIGYQSDLEKLRLEHPEISGKLDRIVVEVDPRATGGEGGNDGFTGKQEQVTQEMEATMNAIRKLPMFETFKLPPTPNDLIAVASDGPIVIFCTTTLRSDAIIVTNTGIKSLALPGLLYTAAEEYMSQIPKLIRSKRTYRAGNKTMRKILLWLWDVAVEPVLNTLVDNLIPDGSLQCDNDLPRIWWIGLGPLSMAPFHAAGNHSPGSVRNTISRVVSSYIPTIKALSNARHKKLENLGQPDTRLLLVSMPNTPGMMPLPNTTKEVEGLANLVEGKMNTTLLKSPSGNQVLTELPLHDIIHLACHGVTDSGHPSNSHVVLQNINGSEPETIDRLTVHAIANMSAGRARIAYLSACGTSENDSLEIANRSIDIAGGFQLVGFSHVLSTRWAPNDTASRQVAGDFYKLLVSMPIEGDHRNVSFAFHCAVKRLRDQNLRQPLKWASFVHTGA